MTSSATESFILELIQKSHKPQLSYSGVYRLRRRWVDVAAHRAVRHASVPELVEAVGYVARLTHALIVGGPGETVHWGDGPVVLKGRPWIEESQVAPTWFTGWSAAVAVGDPSAGALGSVPWSTLRPDSEDAFWRHVLDYAAGGGAADLQSAIEGVAAASLADTVAQRVYRSELQVWLDVEQGTAPRFSEALEAFRAMSAGDDRISASLHLALLGANEEARRRGLPTSADPLLPALVVRG